MDGWITGFEVAECETVIEWRDTSPHGKKVSFSSCNGDHCVSQSVIYVQINTSIPEKEIAETSGHKSSKALRYSSVLHCSAASSNWFHQQNRFSNIHVNCFLPNMDIAMLTPGRTPKRWGRDNRALLIGNRTVLPMENRALAVTDLRWLDTLNAHSTEAIM